MKRNLKIAAYIFIMCCALTSCDFLGWRTGPYTYDCVWNSNNDKDARFYNASIALQLPLNREEDESRFENDMLSASISGGLYRMMEDVHLYNYLASSFDLKWTASVVKKICSSYTDSIKSITVNLDNYTQYFTTPYEDKLQGTPYIQEGNYISPCDIRHSFVLQLHDVENRYENKFGTMTWEYDWNCPTAMGTDEWGFEFPNDYSVPGVVGKFVPNRMYLLTRRIYVNGQFENVQYRIL